MMPEKDLSPAETRSLIRELETVRAELEDARRQYFDLYDLAPAGIFTLDEAGGILKANLTVAAQFGVKRDVLAKRPLGEYIHPEDRDLFRRHYEKFTAKNAAAAIELRMLRADSSFFWARLELTLGYDSDGALLCRAVLSDVTERVRTQVDLLRLRAAVDQAHDGLAVADMQGRIQFVNRVWAKEHGYTKEELLGKPLSIFHTKEQLEKDVIPFNKNVLALGSWVGEVGHVHRNGTTFTRWMSTVLLHDADDKVTGFVGMTTDLSNAKRAGESTRVDSCE
jgi:PAS domain S-box-containing protein